MALDANSQYLSFLPDGFYITYSCENGSNFSTSPRIENVSTTEQSKPESITSDVNSPYLSFLPEEYKYKLLRYESKDEKNFYTSFRIKNILNKEQAKEWLTLLQEKSKFIWRTARSRKRTGRFVVHRTDYRCQHKTDSRFISNIKTNKNTNCPATLKITIQRYYDVPKFKKIDDETKEYPCVVELHHCHNHCADDPLALRHRDMSLTTKNKLLNYYVCGHSATSARNAIKAELMAENPDEYATLIVDNSIMPTLSVIQHFFNSISKNCIKEECFEDVEKFLLSYCTSTGGKARAAVTNSHIVIALCTPIMLRTIARTPQVQELILVDASGSVNSLNHRAYFFIAPSVAGGLPIGCIITDTEKEEVFETGVELLKTFFPDNLKNDGPQVFIIDGDLNEKIGVSSVWPEANILWCQFHVLKAAWRWLFDEKQGISKSDGLSFYFLVKDLVYSSTEEILVENVKALQNNVSNESFLTYILKLWDTRFLWATCYRKNIPVLATNTNNCIEALFRVLNDIVLKKVKARNLIQFTNFIVTEYERYLYERYLDFSMGRYNNTISKRFIVDRKTLIPESNITFNKKINIYTIKSSPSSKKEYNIDLENCLCNCNTGQACQHICSVVQAQNISKCWYDPDIKIMMYIIANNETPPQNFLKSLKCDPNETPEVEDDLPAAYETAMEMDIESDQESSVCDREKNIENLKKIDQKSSVCDKEKVIENLKVIDCESEQEPSFCDKEKVIENLKEIDSESDQEPSISFEKREKVIENLKEWTANLCQKVKEDDAFVDATEIFLSNHSKYCTTDADFFTALYNYGSSSICE